MVPEIGVYRFQNYLVKMDGLGSVEVLQFRIVQRYREIEKLQQKGFQAFHDDSDVSEEIVGLEVLEIPDIFQFFLSDYGNHVSQVGRTRSLALEALVEVDISLYEVLHHFFEEFEEVQQDYEVSVAF